MKSLVIMWVPSHYGVAPNHYADASATAYMLLPTALADGVRDSELASSAVRYEALAPGPAGPMWSAYLADRMVRILIEKRAQ